MHVPHVFLCVTAAAALLSSCAPPESESRAAILAPDEIPQAVRATGATVSQSLAGNLKSLLSAALQQGGPVHAIEVCQQTAAPATITVDQQFAGQASVRRTASRVRNAGNAPDPIDLLVLQTLENRQRDSEPLPEEIVTLSDEGIYRYYKPLPTQELCLTCHGDPAAMPADLRAALASLYPQDQATGFALGDLRGVIRVELHVAP